MFVYHMSFYVFFKHKCCFPQLSFQIGWKGILGGGRPNKKIIFPPLYYLFIKQSNEGLVYFTMKKNEGPFFEINVSIFCVFFSLEKRFVDTRTPI